MAKFHRTKIDTIHVGDRLRPIDPAYVDVIAASMAERGQISPIMVRATPAKNGGTTPFTLVAGGYRITAALALGWTEIDAITVVADQAEAQLLEISENLYRNELNALDRALFLMKYREIYEDSHGKIDRVKNLKQSKGHDDLSIFAHGRELAKLVRERLGFGENTYKRAIRIAQNLHPVLRDAVRGTSLENDQAKLLKLSKEAADDQVKVAAALREHPDVDKAMSLLPSAKSNSMPDEEKLIRQFERAWTTMEPASREQALKRIGAILKNDR